MSRRNTEEIDVLREHYPSSHVIGLYEVGTCRTYEFAECTLDDQPKRILTIGRARYSDIRVMDPTVSQVHCEIIRRDDGMFLLQDADSTNGTFVNDIRIEQLILWPGMWIFVGKTEIFVMGQDRKIPLRAKTTTSFWRRAAYVYGSNRKAAKHVGKSHMTIQRAQQRVERE